MRVPRYRRLLDKSLAASVSAIELYNKPNFQFREEAFSILMITAWELLLKALILKRNKNDLKSITVFEYRKRKDGKRTTRKYPKENRAGNNMTIGIMDALDHVFQDVTIDFDQNCYQNVVLLIELRDNAVHFFNKDLDFSKQVQEIGTATLRNYMTLASDWFSEVDFSEYNFFLMPMTFFHESDVVKSFSVKRRNEQTRNFIDYLQRISSTATPPDDTRFSISVEMDINVVKHDEENTTKVRFTNDPNAPELRLSEHEIRRTHPLDYQQLTSMLTTKYSDFKQNQEYHTIRKTLESKKKYCHVRYLDPSKKSGTSKRFYSTEVFKEFDKHYSRS